MSSIAELLKEFSAESAQAEIEENNLVEGQVGADEMVVSTDETSTELEEAIEEVAEAVNDQEKVADTTETLLDAAESLENAVAIIENARLQGQRVNGIAMQIWARGVADSMEARQIPVEVYGDLLETFGDSFESDSYTDYSVEAEEKSEGIMTKIWNMIKAAFARARDFLSRLIGWFGKSAEAIIKAGYKLKEASKDKKELKSKDAKVNGAPYGDLADTSNNVKPIDILKRTLDTFVATNDASNLMYGLAAQNATLLKDPSAMGAGKANEQNTVAAAKKFEELNGKMIGSKEIKVEKKEGSGVLTDGRISLKLELTGGATGSKEQSPMSIGDIRTLADTIINFGETIKKETDHAKRTQGKLVVDFPKKDDGKHTIDTMKERRKVARSISSAASLAGTLRNKISTASLGVAKKAYVYGMANVRLYK